jgi:hypothetical protein
MLREQREHKDKAARLGPMARVRNYQPSGAVIVKHWHVKAAPKPRAWQSVLASVIPDTTVSAKSGCPWEAVGPAPDPAFRIQRAAFHRDDCEGVTDVYEYYDAYASSYNNDAVSVDIALEVEGDEYLFQRLVIDVETDILSDGTNVWVDEPNMQIDIVEEYIDWSYDLEQQWRGMNCSDETAIRNYFKNKLGAAIVTVFVVSGFGMASCAEMIALLNAHVIGIVEFVGCSAFIYSVSSWSAAIQFAMDIGSMVSACGGGLSPATVSWTAPPIQDPRRWLAVLGHS